MRIKNDGTTLIVDDLTDAWVENHLPSLRNEILEDSPFGYWRQNDGLDETGHGYNLTPYNIPASGASLDASDTDASILLDGSNNLWDSSKRAAFDLTGNWSITCLIHPTSFVGGSDVARKGSMWGLYLHSDNTLRAFVRNASLTTITAIGPTLTVDTTYQAGASYDGATVKLYLNGMLEASAAQTGAMDVDNDAAFTIGLAARAGGYVGRIDEVALFTTALSAGRFAAYYEKAT